MDAAMTMSAGTPISTVAVYKIMWSGSYRYKYKICTRDSRSCTN